MHSLILRLIISVFMLNAFVLAQKVDQLYVDKLFGVGISSDVVYDSVKNLHLKTIKPTYISIPQTQFPNGHPAVLVFHGGGWQVNGGDKYDGLALAMAKEALVKRGYIVISIEYRLMPQTDGCNVNPAYKNSLINMPGKPYGNKIPNQVGFGVAAYRAAQDTRQATKYVFDNAASFGIDARNIFLLGQSAGAYNILHSVTVDDGELTPYNVAVKAEGKLESRQNVNAIVAMSGGVFDLNFISSQDKTPILLTYFSNDLVVPSNSAKLLPLCTLQTLFDPTPLSHGSDSIIQKMRQLSLSNVEAFRINAIGHVGSTNDINNQIEQKIVQFLKAKIVR